MKTPFQMIDIGSLVTPTKKWDPRKNVDSMLIDYIDISSIDNNSKTIYSPVEVHSHEAPNRARQLVNSGDILVSTVRPNLNAVAQVSETYDGATASTGFSILRPNPKKLNSRFLYHWVCTPYFIENMVSRSTGASYPAVSDKIVKESHIPIPLDSNGQIDIKIQRRIADILDKADGVRRKRQEAIRLTDELLRSAFLEMFGDPVTNPKGWDVVELGKVSTIQGGLQVTHKRSINPIEVPYLRVANVFRDRLSLEEIKQIRVTEAELKRVRLSKGDMLFVEGHGNPEEIGRAAVWDGSIEQCVHQNHLIRVRVHGEVLIPEYVSALVNSDGGRRNLQRMGKTTSGLNTISSKQLSKLEVFVPPIEIQREYLQLTEKIKMMQCNCVGHSKALETLFDSLVQRAFRGEL